MISLPVFVCAVWTGLCVAHAGGGLLLPLVVLVAFAVAEVVRYRSRHRA